MKAKVACVECKFYKFCNESSEFNAHRCSHPTHLELTFDWNPHGPIKTTTNCRKYNSHYNCKQFEKKLTFIEKILKIFSKSKKPELKTDKSGVCSKQVVKTVGDILTAKEKS